MRQAAHAIGLILLDRLTLFRRDKDQRVGGCPQRFCKARTKPFARAHQVIDRHPEILAAHPNVKLVRLFAHLFPGKGDLTLTARFQIAQERCADRARIKAGGGKFVEQDIAFLQRGQPVFPLLRDRAFLRQQRARAKLKGDLAEFGIVDPIIPVPQKPNAARHHDWGGFGNAAFPHHLAQRLDARIGIFGL